MNSRSFHQPQLGPDDEVNLSPCFAQAAGDTMVWVSMIASMIALQAELAQREAGQQDESTRNTSGRSVIVSVESGGEMMVPSPCDPEPVGARE